MLTVSGVIAFRNGQYLAIDPEIDHPIVEREASVLLLRPDGSELEAVASIITPIVNSHPYTPPGKVCLLRGLKKSEVPIGTQVWLMAKGHTA